MPVLVQLRDVTEADFEAFYRHQLDPEATRIASFPSREREAFFAHWCKILATPATFKQTILANGQVAGNIVCWDQQGRWCVGYWLGREFWGKGVATAALTAALERIPMRPLYAEVAPTNPASRRVVEKAGFVLQGEEGGYLVFELRARP